MEKEYLAIIVGLGCLCLYFIGTAMRAQADSERYHAAVRKSEKMGLNIPSIIRMVDDATFPEDRREEVADVAA